MDNLSDTAHPDLVAPDTFIRAVLRGRPVLAGGEDRRPRFEEHLSATTGLQFTNAPGMTMA